MAAAAESCPGSDGQPLPSIQSILAASSLFEALGLPESPCEPGTVKLRYKQLALRVHPDKCSDALAKQAFQRISEAFDTLHTRETQARYLRERAGARGKAPRRREQGVSARAGNADASKAWWDTRTWEEFERRFRNREQMERELRERFFSHVQGKFQHRRLRQQVLGAERSCEQLDRLMDVAESELWPPELRELPNKAELQVSAFEGAKTAWDELLERKELEDPEYCACRLVDLLTHLRTVHVYCLHCGCHFESADDLDQNCPGFDEEAHENADNMAMRRPPSGVSCELAPPPKRQRPRPPPPPEDGIDDPLNAFLAVGRAGAAPPRSGPGGSGPGPRRPTASRAARVAAPSQS
eukprot:CAMPEP_0117570024 /NCGR_PEP_ID=MMETSP0784-20121206/58973_1 /TAXON_ID=39447 /ORGANISM="" /LENGTH=353 /DNA_ID=CAMNT_0005368041 /DNA_START=83 /DNA_END=1140 /DNA_ORIENTATION=-